MNISELARDMGVSAYGLATFAGEPQNKALTVDEARELIEAWHAAYAASVNDGVAGPDMVHVEYHAEDGETVHELEHIKPEDWPHYQRHMEEYKPGMFKTIENHSQCGHPGYYCPTGEHLYKPLELGGSY